MKPKRPPIETDRQEDMFKVELEEIIDVDHELVRLAGYIDWGRFDEAYGGLYSPDRGRPAKPTRLMAGLHYLKESEGLSDERLLKRWTENPYRQYFCGMKYFEHKLPCDPSWMSKWRQLIGEAGLEKMLEVSVEAARRMKYLKAVSFKRVNVDTTVQEKAIAYPTDAKLCCRMREKLVGLAAAEGVKLRQSYKRLGKKALFRANRYAHARQMKRARKMIKKQKTYLGRVVRDIERKIAGKGELEQVFAGPLSMARRLLAQERGDKNKLYSIHAPEAECISKGKAHKKYEFGVKVGIATTSREGLVIGIKALPGNPYDGHTLAANIEQAERITGRQLDGDVFVDLGYRGHNYEGQARVHVVGRARRGMDSLSKWMKRRAAIEPEIGHMKNDGCFGRNHLAGTEGDKINAILCGCGHNVRKLLKFLSARPALAAA